MGSSDSRIVRPAAPLHGSMHLRDCGTRGRGRDDACLATRAGALQAAAVCGNALSRGVARLAGDAAAAAATARGAAAGVRRGGIQAASGAEHARGVRVGPPRRSRRGRVRAEPTAGSSERHPVRSNRNVVLWCRSTSDEGMRILEGAPSLPPSLSLSFSLNITTADALWRLCLADLLKRQLGDFEEGCLYFLATAHRRRGVRSFPIAPSSISSSPQAGRGCRSSRLRASICKWGLTGTRPASEWRKSCAN